MKNHHAMTTGLLGVGLIFLGLGFALPQVGLAQGFSRTAQSKAPLSATDILSGDVSVKYNAAKTAFESAEKAFTQALDNFEKYKLKTDANLTSDTEAAFETARLDLIRKALAFRSAEREKVKLELQNKLGALYSQTQESGLAAAPSDELPDGASVEERIAAIEKKLNRSGELEHYTEKIDLYNQCIELNDKRRELDAVMAEYPDLYLLVENRAAPAQYLPSNSVLLLRSLAGFARGSTAVFVQRWIGKQLARTGKEVTEETVASVGSRAVNFLRKASRGVGRNLGRGIWLSMFYFELEGFSEGLGNIVALSIDPQTAEASMLQGIAQHYKEFKRGAGIRSYVNPFDEFSMLYGIWLHVSESFDRADADKTEVAINQLEELIDQSSRDEQAAEIVELLKKLDEVNAQLRQQLQLDKIDASVVDAAIKASSQTLLLQERLRKQTKTANCLALVPAVFDPMQCLRDAPSHVAAAKR